MKYVIIILLLPFNETFKVADINDLTPQNIRLFDEEGNTMSSSNNLSYYCEQGDNTIRIEFCFVTVNI